MTSSRSRTTSAQPRKPLDPAPPASSASVLKRMRAQARSDTGPEVAVRKPLWAAGLRYRVDARPLQDFRRRADLVFRPERLAVFVDGCYRHGCRWHANWPSSNREWWEEKIRRTRQRDRETDGILRRAGFTVLRVWEHTEPHEAAKRVLHAFRAARRKLRHTQRVKAKP